MKRKELFYLWAAMFILCAGLGFIPHAEGLGKALLILLAVGFFVPGGVLLYRAAQKKDWGTLCLVRNLSFLSLGATFAALLLNFLLVDANETMGALAYGLLVLVSSPMACGQYWVLGMFGWACLLVASMSRLRKLRE